MNTERGGKLFPSQKDRDPARSEKKVTIRKKFSVVVASSTSFFCHTFVFSLKTDIT